MNDLTIADAVDETADFLAELAEAERPSIANEAGRLIEMWAELGYVPPLPPADPALNLPRTRRCE